MTYLVELGAYQAKVLMTAKAIVELDNKIAATVETTQRERLIHEADGRRAMLRMYEGMVGFLNCCVERERKTGLEEAAHRDAKKLG